MDNVALLLGALVRRAGGEIRVKESELLAIDEVVHIWIDSSKIDREVVCQLEVRDVVEDNKQAYEREMHDPSLRIGGKHE